MKCIAVALCLTFAPVVSAQVVFVGKQPDKDWCYKAETIRPNLVLSESVRILGRITDIVGAPLVNSRVELRKYISQRKQTTVAVTTTDDHGHFDMGTVKPGRYRFLASPNRAFQQPTDLKCPSGDRCELNITLQLNSTDLPVSVCPIR